MQMHAHVKIDAIASKCYFQRMSRQPAEDVVQAWVRLVRAAQTVQTGIEGALKQANLPPLAWYDVLLELKRAPGGILRPVELERRLLLAQYNASRLIDRMERAGLVARRACPEDGRGQLVAITEAGREMQRRMWRVYGPAIAEHVGAKFRPGDARVLSDLLGKLLQGGTADAEPPAPTHGSADIA